MLTLLSWFSENVLQNQIVTDNMLWNQSYFVFIKLITWLNSGYEMLNTW